MSNKKRTSAPSAAPSVSPTALRAPRVFEGEQGDTDSQRLPWSYRHGIVLALVVTVLSAIITAFVGTLLHRLGLRHDFPIGLILALVLIGLSAWSARARSGTWGLVVHFMVSMGVLMHLAGSNSGRAYLMPVGTSLFPTWIGQNVSYVWLLGAVIVQLVVMFFPHRWFVIEPREDSAVDSAADGDGDDGDDENDSDAGNDDDAVNDGDAAEADGAADGTDPGASRDDGAIVATADGAAVRADGAEAAR